MKIYQLCIASTALTISSKSFCHALQLHSRQAAGLSSRVSSSLEASKGLFPDDFFDDITQDKKDSKNDGKKTLANIKTVEDIDEALATLLQTRSRAAEASLEPQPSLYKTAKEYEEETERLKLDLDNARLAKRQVKKALKEASRRRSPQQMRQQHASARAGAWIGITAGLYATFVQELELEFVEPIILVPVLGLATGWTFYTLSSFRGPVGNFFRFILGDSTIWLSRILEESTDDKLDSASLAIEMSVFRTTEEIKAAPKIAYRVIREAGEDFCKFASRTLGQARDDIVDFPRYVTYSTVLKLEEIEQRIVEASQKTQKQISTSTIIKNAQDSPQSIQNGTGSTAKQASSRQKEVPQSKGRPTLKL